MGQRITLSDVAQAAGVGMATVSRAMGDHPDVSAATRDRIRKVAQDLGYRPSVAARALRSGGFRAISVMVPDNQWGWWEPVAHACVETASAAGYQVLVHPVGGGEGGLAEAITGLSNVPTEGVIVISVPDQKSVREACDSIGIPGVAIDDSSARHPLPLDLSRQLCRGPRGRPAPARDGPLPHRLCPPPVQWRPIRLGRRLLLGGAREGIPGRPHRC